MYSSRTDRFGVAKPSALDAVLTRRLREALAMVDIRLLDHLVNSETEYVRVAEVGLL